MKKKIIVLISSGIILTGAAVYFVHGTLAKANTDTASYEHYYNDTNNEDSTTTDLDESSDSNSTDTINTTIHSNADSIDTDPTSITVFVNKEYGLPSDYIPDDLVVPDVKFNISYFDEKKLMRKEAAEALEDLFDAASQDGYQLYGISAYRSYARQQEIYNNNIRNKGITHTSQYSAKPGYSEHQTGLSIDVSATSVGNGLEEVFADSKEGQWLAANSYKFGFIIRYPKGKEDITGYSYEPWHIRYVGKDLAVYLYQNNLTLEEYYNYTPSLEFIEQNSEQSTVDVDPNDYTETTKETPTPSPSPSESASPSPSPTPSASPDADATTEPEATETPTTTKEPQATSTPKPTKNPTPSPSLTPSPTPSADPSDDGSETTEPTEAPSTSPSASPSTNE